MQSDAGVSLKAASAVGARQSEAHHSKIQWDRRFCINSGAKSLGHIPDMAGAPLLDLVTKSLCQNGQELSKGALGTTPCPVAGKTQARLPTALTERAR
ncbi:hypothetical protein JYU02_01215 [bacterium AH-315-P15]|nr:hypothetical protein [bacterium AH-315-P15]